jgi:DNA-binding GntR family transcriptional regulator
MTSQDPRIYVRVLLHLREQIDSGTLRPGEPAPTIQALCRHFDCTRQTVAKALRLLADEELLTRYPGLGYYVTSP